MGEIQTTLPVVSNNDAYVTSVLLHNYTEENAN